MIIYNKNMKKTSVSSLLIFILSLVLLWPSFILALTTTFSANYDPTRNEINVRMTASVEAGDTVSWLRVSVSPNLAGAKENFCGNMSTYCESDFSFSSPAPGTYTFRGFVDVIEGGNNVTYPTDPPLRTVTVSAPRDGGGGGGGGGLTCPGDMDSCPPNAVCIPNPLCAESFDQLLDAIINFIFWVGIALAPVMLIISGLLFVISAGDPKKVQTAKNFVLYTIIGLAILIAAKGLIAVLKSILGVTS